MRRLIMVSRIALAVVLLLASDARQQNAPAHCSDGPGLCKNVTLGSRAGRCNAPRRLRFLLAAGTGVPFFHKPSFPAWQVSQAHLTGQNHLIRQQADITRKMQVPTLNPSSLLFNNFTEF